MVEPLAMPIFKIIVGLILIFVASRIVGFVVKAVGLGFLLLGGYEYYFVKAGYVDVFLPVILGLILIFVGKNVAETAVRVAGLLVVVWGVLGLGVI